eukprot:c15769_g1_i1.p1 GENE.c15769_g1_i1~~c15769_g1_i1.p1  ORF type:complete len:170 (-),score=28.98 c15769_g1_i1:41-550(-)
MQALERVFSVARFVLSSKDLPKQIQRKPPQVLSGALKTETDPTIRDEFIAFTREVFPNQKFDLKDSTIFVLDRGGITSSPRFRWTALLIHSTNQIFLRPPVTHDVRDGENLAEILIFAEGLGVADTFVFVPRLQNNADLLIKELVRLDFEQLSPRANVSSDFMVLRFRF